MTDPHAPAHPPDPLSVAVELERLRGTMGAGFARVDGSPALLVRHSDQTDRQLADHEARLDALGAGPPAARRRHRDGGGLRDRRDRLADHRQVIPSGSPPQT